jgi:hypothetical protein
VHPTSIRLLNLVQKSAPFARQSADGCVEQEEAMRPGSENVSDAFYLERSNLGGGIGFRRPSTTSLHGDIRAHTVLVYRTVANDRRVVNSLEICYGQGHRASSF